MLNFVARVHNSENAGYLEHSYTTHADLIQCIQLESVLERLELSSLKNVNETNATGT